MTEGQRHLLEYLFEAGAEGRSLDDIADNKNKVGFTPADQAGLVKQGLWVFSPSNNIVHPSFAPKED